MIVMNFVTLKVKAKLLFDKPDSGFSVWTEMVGVQEDEE